MTPGITGMDNVDQKKSKKKRGLFPVLIVGGFLLGLAIGWLIIRTASDSDPSEQNAFYGNVIESPNLAADFTLTADADRLSPPDLAAQASQATVLIECLE